MNRLLKTLLFAFFLTALSFLLAIVMGLLLYVFESGWVVFGIFFGFYVPMSYLIVREMEN